MIILEREEEGKEEEEEELEVRDVSLDVSRGVIEE